MKRGEFLAHWKKAREAKLRELYRDDPHGPACLAMSLTEVEEEGLKLWRKLRKTLAAMSLEEAEQMWNELPIGKPSGS